MAFISTTAGRFPQLSENTCHSLSVDGRGLKTPQCHGCDTPCPVPPPSWGCRGPRCATHSVRCPGAGEGAPGTVGQEAEARCPLADPSAWRRARTSSLGPCRALPSQHGWPFLNPVAPGGSCPRGRAGEGHEEGTPPARGPGSLLGRGVRLQPMAGRQPSAHLWRSAFMSFTSHSRDLFVCFPAGCGLRLGARGAGPSGEASQGG